MVPLAIGCWAWLLYSLLITGGVLAIVIWCLMYKFNILFIRRNKVNEESSFYGGMLVAKTLRIHGVKHVFTLVGGHISPILVAAEQLGIRVVDTRHEATAVFAADAVARLTRGIGVAAVTAGPGITNCVTAAKNAQLAESPVLIIGGAAATILKGKGALQDIDQLPLFANACKFCGTANSVREIVPLLRKAIQIALSGVPGPVFVEFPIDVLYSYSIVKSEALGKQSTRPTWKNRLINWYIKNYLDNIFAGAWEPQDLNPLPVTAPMPKPALVDECAELLLRAKRPLLIIGSQAMLPPVPVIALRHAAFKLGIPTYLGGMARGLLGRSNRFQIRHSRKEALGRADLVILAGAVCDFRLSYGKTLPKHVPVVSVNRDPKLAQLNAGLFWNPRIIIRGDVATFIVDLAAAAAGYQCELGWIPYLLSVDRKRKLEIHAAAREESGNFLNPLKLLVELENILPNDAILIGDGGDFVATASYILRPRAPLCWLDPGPFGTLGVGGGFALGAKLVRPNVQVWILYGDGACGYSIMEYDTFVRHKVPVLSVVGNDAGWTQIERSQRDIFGSSIGCDLAHTSYHLIVRGIGARGVIITKDCADIAAVIRAAQDLNNEENSVLINAVIAKSNFRAGSISV